MRRALLIGFEYEEILHLPGITIDLYLAYQFLKKNGWKDTEIEILSDISKDHPTEVLKRSILEKVVSSDILSFIEDCKEKNIYTHYNTQNHYSNFYTTLTSFATSPESSLFIYYSGHAKDGHLILPGGSLCSINNFKGAIFRNVLNEKIEKRKQKNFFILLDCCQCDLELTFNLIDGVYRFENENFNKGEVLCISSSLSEQNSMASKIGSLFSRHIFKVLDKDKDKDISYLIKEVNKELKGKQTAIVSASKPIHAIFGWLFSFPTLSLSIHPLYLEVNL